MWSSRAARPATVNKKRRKERRTDGLHGALRCTDPIDIQGVSLLDLNADAQRWEKRLLCEARRRVERGRGGREGREGKEAEEEDKKEGEEDKDE